MNKRNNNSGGGQSSLGYLFGSGDLGQQQNHQSKASSSPVCMPPYGTDDKEEKSPEKAPTPPKKDDPAGSFKNYIYHAGDGDNKSTGVLVTGRPSTRVRSVPGGDSSLGYLFGEK
ncbi:hypothetical protein L1987_73541 [Smallanthus sonchifolius]|uniref:Uncharacterized protein n=1 Tax=Smallanthus sonchifolius TaxID=185202 RepID=A0ACB9A121_9ASTR|nr:hypothetical protein L1987_73541 [Smallanthus sonchifolius]